MSKAQTKLTHHPVTIGAPCLRVGVWQPAAGKPLEQVHLLVHTSVLAAPFLIEFKDAGSLDRLIEGLVGCRREVWPHAEPLDYNKKFDNQPTTEEPNEQKN